MSPRQPRSYRFATPAQWSQCILHRVDVTANGVTPAPRLAMHARQVTTEGQVTAVAVDPYGAPLWRLQRDGTGSAQLLRRSELGTILGPFDIDGTLATSPRWLADRHWLWGFVPNGSIVRRYERETLQHDRSIDISHAAEGSGRAIVDFTSDTRGGVWLLTHSADSTYELQHFDCEGRPRGRRPVPPAACEPLQIGSVRGGRQLVLLAAGGKRLVIVDAPDVSVARVMDLRLLLDGWVPTRLSTDGRNRTALWGAGEGTCGLSALIVLDASGDTVDEPVPDLFTGGVYDIAPSSSTVWFATARGLWALDNAPAGTAEGARAREATLLTSPLMSPESDAERGWLRAEVAGDLPRGAVIEAQFASTNDDRFAESMREIANDRSSTAEQRMHRIWTALEQQHSPKYTFSGPSTPGVPLAIPLLRSEDRWLWLRLHVVSPPGTEAPTLREMRILYPRASIDRDLPAVFKDPQNDPGGFLRRFVGVLESTTQRIDERISRIGSHIDPETAPDDWLDYLAAWLDLPWDDGLPVMAKRRVLQRAGQLLERRGTRQGLELLLRALLGAAGSATVVDVLVDHPPARPGWGGRGVRLPMVLAGTSTRAATLGAKAVLGRSRLACGAADGDPLKAILPTLKVRISAGRDTYRDLHAVLEQMLTDYIPAGVRLQVRWHVGPTPMGAEEDAPIIELDADGPGALSATSHLGRTVLAGRRTLSIDELGLDTDLRLP